MVFPPILSEAGSQWVSFSYAITPNTVEAADYRDDLGRGHLHRRRHHDDSM